MFGPSEDRDGPTETNLETKLVCHDLAGDIFSGGCKAEPADGIASARLEPSHHVHPTMTAHPEVTVVPIGFPVDGVGVQASESATSFWFIDMVTTKRHLVAVRRRPYMCRCGCGGNVRFTPSSNLVSGTTRP